MENNFSYEFIRYGGLSKMDQSIRHGQDSFHAPPRRKGIYAFPVDLVDKFLLSATNDPRNSSNKSYWVKDDNGNKIKSKDFYESEGYDKKNDRPYIKKEYLDFLKKRKIKIKDIFEVMCDDERDPVDGIDWFICAYKAPRIFKYSGEIWCHLKPILKPEQIIEEVGSWCKVDMEDFLIALKKEKHSLRKDMIKTFGVNWKDNNPFRHYCTDHLEVFIEKIN